MAELFGAIAAAVSLLDLILKRVNTISRFKKDADRATTELARRSRELDLRTKVLDTIRADLKPPTNVPGAPLAVDCVEDCVKEMVQLKTILKLFEAQFATGKSWRAALQTKLEYAWKKEDMDALYRDICSANERLADAVMACQLYLATTTSRVLGEIKDGELPAIATSVQDISARGLPPIQDALQEIRTQDVPAMNIRLDEIRTQVPALVDSVEQTRMQDLPAMTRNITTSVASNTGQVVRLLGAESQHTRDTVLERGRLTSREIDNLKTYIRQQLVSSNGDLENSLLPRVRQHMDGCIEIVVQELRTSQGQAGSSRASSESQSSDFSSAQSESSSTSISTSSKYMQTKQTAAVRWERRLPLGLGHISLRREVRRRVLLRIRKYISEVDTSVDTETIYTLAFVPYSSIFGNTLTGCNWKHSFRSSRRLATSHPAWRAAQENNLPAIIDYFQQGILSINDNNSYGDTLLHVASEYYSYELCEWLIDNGADSQATNDELETAVFKLVGESSAGGDTPPRPASSYAQDDPLLRLLLERCQLDPNDKNKYGQSVLEAPALPSLDRYARVFTLAMPLCTEPPGHRIKQSVHTLVAGIAPSTSLSTIMRLRFLFAEYKKLGLPEKDNDSRKWWHTTNLFWRLIEEVLYPRTRLGKQDGSTTNAGEINHESDGEWAECQLRDIIRGGIDVQLKINEETLLDRLLNLSSQNSNREIDVATKFLRWLTILHKAGTSSIADYLYTAQSQHPAGRIVEVGSHYYREYPFFRVLYTESSDDVTFTKGLFIADHDIPRRMPGSFDYCLSQTELNYCQRHDLFLSERYLGVSRFEEPDGDRTSDLATIAKESKDNNICEWELEDGSKGRMYDLWTISTAGFARGDYSFETATKYSRDYGKNPLWVEYQDSWVAIWQPDGSGIIRASISPSPPATLLKSTGPGSGMEQEPQVVVGDTEQEAIRQVNIGRRRKSI